MPRTSCATRWREFGRSWRVDLAHPATADLEVTHRSVLDNSVEHGGSFVEVTLHEEGTAAVVTVTDNGPGIPEWFHERIFERFARVDDARAAAQGGAGLGLAIAREIIEARGGAIVADANHSPDARFALTIPRSVEGSDVETAANRHALP